MPKRKVSLEGTQPKPSLSSLKPDKAKGEAARKRAVKRIVATASKKAPATRMKIISEALHVTTAKKPNLRKTTSVATMPVVVVLPIKKTETKRTLHKAPADSAKSKNLTRKAKNTVPTDLFRKREFAVQLPSTMSIRAREKALAILQQALHDFEKPAQHIAYVSGVCFVVLGSYLALSFSGVLPPTAMQSAAVLQSAGSTTGMAYEVKENFSTPVFTLIERIPNELSSNAQYTFSLTHVKNVAVKIFSLGDATQTDTAVDELVPGTRRYTIEANTLKPGKYVVKAMAEAEGGIGRYTYELGEFAVPQPAGGTQATSTASSSTEHAESSETSSKPEAVVASTTKPLTEVHSSMQLIADADLSGQKTIKIGAPKDARFVEIYVRPVRSINARFLGLAERKSDDWYYFFNTINVPNGDYELFARTRIEDTFHESNSVNVRIANIADFTMSEVNDGSEPLDEGQTIEDVATPVRTFSDYSFAEASTSESSSGEVAVEADAIFAQYNQQLNDILKRYSVAVQSGDELLVKTALDELFKLKDSILLEVLNDSSKNYLADNISQEFDARLETIKKRIATFEELRRSAGSEDIRLDYDKDGISDFDERNLYHTNPEQADTDNDGVTDGIEIMRGFDPRSPLGETVINYELPQNVLGLVRDDSLQIDSVQPLVNHLSDSESIVQAEIHGTALPNSYVTLYVFSSPNITTVRTDDKGSFSYTFEKELEDGEHEVYAAVTDNSGAIVAVSAPYKFAKQASIFTPSNGLSAAANADSIQTGDFSRMAAYNAITGVGVVALGLILLMLATNLRRRNSQLTEDFTGLVNQA